MDRKINFRALPVSKIQHDAPNTNARPALWPRHVFPTGTRPSSRSVQTLLHFGDQVAALSYPRSPIDTIPSLSQRLYTLQADNIRTAILAKCPPVYRPQLHCSVTKHPQLSLLTDRMSLFVTFCDGCCLCGSYFAVFLHSIVKMDCSDVWEQQATWLFRLTGFSSGEWLTFHVVRSDHTAAADCSYDVIWYDMIWYDMIGYDIYDTIWYDMIW